MQNCYTRWTVVGLALLTICSTGCQMYRAPGALLPSMAAAAEDRSIERYASTSGFPSPGDVGLDADDDADE